MPSVTPTHNMSSALKITLGGKAVVCCVHDREKRVVTDPEQVRFLGNALGVEYDPRQHKLVGCPCCQNLFVSPTDTPGLCEPCRGVNKHPLPEGAT